MKWDVSPINSQSLVTMRCLKAPFPQATRLCGTRPALCTRSLRRSRTERIPPRGALGSDDEGHASSSGRPPTPAPHKASVEAKEEDVDVYLQRVWKDMKKDLLKKQLTTEEASMLEGIEYDDIVDGDKLIQKVCICLPACPAACQPSCMPATNMRHSSFSLNPTSPPAWVRTEHPVHQPPLSTLHPEPQTQFLP